MGSDRSPSQASASSQSDTPVQERAPLTVSRRDGVVVMRVENALGDDALITAFDDALRAALDAVTLVLDLRNTPSGGNTNVARAIMGHFVDDVRAYQVHDIPAIERATTVPRRFVEQVLPREPRYPGQLVVLGGRWSGSMGEGLVIGLDAAAEAEVFASDMGDLLGGLYNVDLERSGIRIDLGVERLFHVDGTPREDFVAEHALAVVDRGPGGADAGMDAVLDWLGRQGSASE